jgi:hypothetical protein
VMVLRQGGTRCCFLLFPRLRDIAIDLDLSEAKTKTLHPTRLFAQLTCSTSSQQRRARKPTVSPQHYHHHRQQSSPSHSTTIKKKDLLIQINRKPIIMVPPIRVPRKPKLPIHIRDLLLQTRLLPQRQDLDSSRVLNAVQVREAGFGG